MSSYRTKGARGRSTIPIASPVAVLLPPLVMEPVSLEYAGFVRDLVKGLGNAAQFVPYRADQSAECLREHLERVLRVVATLRLIGMVYEDEFRPSPRHKRAQASLEGLCETASLSLASVEDEPMRDGLGSVALRRRYLEALDGPDRTTVLMLDEPSRVRAGHVNDLAERVAAAGAIAAELAASLQQRGLASEYRVFRGMCAQLCEQMARERASGG